MTRNPAIPLATNPHLLRWVDKMRELMRPAAIHWVDGSEDEYDAALRGRWSATASSRS